MSPRVLVTAVGWVASALLVLGCSGSSGGSSSGGGGVQVPPPSGDPVPADLNAVLTSTFTDAVGDLVPLGAAHEGPGYAVDFPPVDVDRIRLGIDEDYLYMRVEFLGAIPQSLYPVAAAGVVEEQWVKGQGMNISLDVDNNNATGASGDGISGVDLFFAVGFDYGSEVRIYANYGFPDGDIHNATGQLFGELIDGGPGSSFVVVRFNVSGLGSFFPRGTTVELGSWSEAESVNADGSEKYHHFAFDPFTATNWSIP